MRARPTDPLGARQRKRSRVDVDLILATANSPTSNYSDPTEIGRSWLQAGHEEYFFNNISHGIRTAQDLEIWYKLKHAAPSWITAPRYKLAIEILTGNQPPGGLRSVASPRDTIHPQAT